LSVSIRIEDARGTRRVGEGDLPLALGGPGADVPLPGVSAAEPVAWLGLSEGQVFLQPTGGATVLCNGAPVTASHWLHDGDVLASGDTRITVAVGSGGIRLRVEEVPREEGTEPPAIVAATQSPLPDKEVSNPVIQAAEFRPRPIGRAARRRRAFRPAPLLLTLVVVALAALAWFLFTCRAVQVRIEPAPDQVTLEGAFPGWEVRGWRLLRPGAYDLNAEKEGYRPLRTTLEVTAEPRQAFTFALEKLPDLLLVDTGDVQGARVFVDGREAGSTPLEPVELEAGEHLVRVEADGYLDFTTSVTLEGGGFARTLEVALTPRWAPVTFASEPAGAMVRAGGRSLGRTPLTASLKDGTYRIEMDLAGYKAFGGSLTVVANEPQSYRLVRLERKDPVLAVRSEPAGASVEVDGTYQGRTPLDLRLPAGSHQVEISKAGHEPASRQVRLGPGERKELTFTLTARTGEVEVVASPADAQLFVDGEARGAANQTLHLPAVPHRIEVRKEGFETWRTDVTPRPGFPQSLRAELQTKEQARTAALTATVPSPQGREMVLVRGGRFAMGAPRREPGRRANETIREVELSRPYYLAVKEITNREYHEFHASHSSGSVGPYNLTADDNPVVRVRWEDAARYCNWLSTKESLPPAYELVNGEMVAAEPMTTGYRLPTEAEWAWAARYPDGHTALKYPWGMALPVAAESGNYADASARALLSDAVSGYNDTYPVTAPPGKFPPNALGLFDMGGNVAEWVHDLYAMRPPGAGSLERDPTGPEEGEMHVIRGSSWMDDSASELRLSYRDYGNDARPDVGFRIARYAE